MDNVIRCIIAEDFTTLNNIYYNLLNYEKDIEVVGRAYSGSELIELLKTTDTDVILMDIEMEDRNDGIMACKKILKEHPDCKIIILSCHEEEDIILSAFEVGAVDYLLKTDSSTMILEAIRSAYNNSSSISSHVASVIRKRMREFNIMKQSLLYVMNIVQKLTTSEIEVLKFLLEGKKQREIAQIRCVEIVTVKAQVSNILKKFNCSRTSGVIKIIKESEMEGFIRNLKN